MKNLIYIIPILFISLLVSCYSNNSYSDAGFESTFLEDPDFSNLLIVKETEEPVRFYGIVILDKGSCTITIRRPDGSVAREYELTAPGEKRLTAEFQAVKGQWTLEMSSENAEGAYKTKWTNIKEK